MAKKQNNNLNLTNLKKQNKKYDEKIDIEIDGFSIKIDKYWRGSKINEYYKELSKNTQELRLQNHSLDELFSPYAILLVLRHFTSLRIPADINKQLEWMNELTDAGYFSEIALSLPQDQLEKMNDEINNIGNILNNGLDDLFNDLEDYDFENDEVENITTES